MKMKSCLLSIFGLTLVSTFALGANKMTSAQAESRVFYEFGPGVYNPNQDFTPEDLYRPNNYSVAYRADALMLYPNKDVYKNVPNNTVASSDALEDTNFSLIRIYTAEDTYASADTFFRSSDPVVINSRSDAGLNFTLFFTSGMLSAKNIYKIVFGEGLILPYASSDHSIKYSLKETVTYRNLDYKGSKTDIYRTEEWEITKSSEEEEVTPVEPGEIELLPIAAFAREDANYRLHVRGAHITADDFNHPQDTLEIDDYTCKLLIFFGENDYNPELKTSSITVASSKFDLSDSETSFIHTLYEKVIITLSDGSQLPLKDVSNPFTKGMPQYNTYGEIGCISFVIGNKEAPSDRSFNAKDVSEVTVLRGAQFPSFAYTNGNSATEYRYTQLDDITVSLPQFRYTKWSQLADYAFNAADIEITGVATRNINTTINETPVSGVAIDLALSDCNYGDLENMPILAVNEKMTRYVYVNGRSLYYSYNPSELSAYANLEGKKNTISIIIPAMNLSDISEIIVQRGCSVPSLVASSIAIDIYGGYVSYYVLASISFTRNGDNFVKSDQIYWTLWFDGANPIRVRNAQTFDFSENAPIGKETDRKKFVLWEDENGNEVTGYIRITSGREYFGVYRYFYEVQFKNVDKEFSVVVEDNTRLTEVKEAKNMAVPTRSGYAFQGWIDQDGNHFNFVNRIKRDLVLTATWIATTRTDTYRTSGCGGSILATSLIVSLIATTGVALVLVRRNRKGD